MASLSQYTTNGTIGQGGIDKAKAAGWTDAQINAAIAAENIVAGPAIQAQGYGVGSAPAPSPSPSPSSSSQGYIPATPGGSAQFLQGPNTTPGYIGLNSVNQMRAAGYSDYDIMAQINMDGLKMGEEALKSLKSEVDAGSGQSYNYNQYQGGSKGNVFIAGPNQITPMLTGPGATPGYIGMETVNQLKAQGMSDEWIRHQAAMEGLKFGTVADQSLSKETWQEKNERTLDERLAESNSTFSPVTNTANSAKIDSNVETITDFMSPSTNNAVYEDPSSTSASNEYMDFEYGANSTPAITGDVFGTTNSFTPPPLPKTSKKSSIFEQVMNAAPAPLASPQTFSNVIANS